MKDSAGKQYLEAPDRNTPGDWLLTIAVLIVAALMLWSPVWIPMLWPK